MKKYMMLLVIMVLSISAVQAAEQQGNDLVKIAQVCERFHQEKIADLEEPMRNTKEAALRKQLVEEGYSELEVIRGQHQYLKENNADLMQRMIETVGFKSREEMDSVLLRLLRNNAN